jgi:hypothetical protein
MAKTALQTVRHEVLLLQNNRPYNSEVYNDLQAVLSLINEAIDKERKQIEEAYNEGFFDDVWLFSDYYQSKYTKD